MHCRVTGRHMDRLSLYTKDLFCSSSFKDEFFFGVKCSIEGHTKWGSDVAIHWVLTMGSSTPPVSGLDLLHADKVILLNCAKLGDGFCRLAVCLMRLWLGPPNSLCSLPQLISNTQ